MAVDSIGAAHVSPPHQLPDGEVLRREATDLVPQMKHTAPPTKLSRAMIEIILADDHAVIRQQLKRLLAREVDWHVRAEANDGLETVRLVKEIKPDVLVTDLAMPGLHGLEVMRRVRRQSARTRIVVVSIHADEPYVRQAWRNGALGYVRKDEVGRHLLPAIRSALAGDRYLSPALAELSALPAPMPRIPRNGDAFESLNPRERSALQLMAQGCTDAEIGLHLRLTVALAKRLRFFLMQRLNLKTPADLAALARKKGLVGECRDQ